MKVQKNKTIIKVQNIVLIITVSCEKTPNRKTKQHKKSKY